MTEENKYLSMQSEIEKGYVYNPNATIIKLVKGLVALEKRVEKLEKHLQITIDVTKTLIAAHK